MGFEECKQGWLKHAQHLGDLSIEVIGQCDRLDTAKGTKDPKVIALALLSRSLGHFKGTFRLLEIGCVVEARTLTRCIFENLFVQGALAEHGDAFVQAMVSAEAKSRQSRGNWILEWLEEGQESSPYEETLRKNMERLRALHPKASPINFADITRAGALKNAYLWYKQLSSDAGHPSLESIGRHITREADGTIWVSVDHPATEKDILDTMEWACQALMGVLVGANQIAGPVKAGEKLSTLFDEFLRLAGVT